MGNEMFFYITVIRIIFGNGNFYKINSSYTNDELPLGNRSFLIHSLKDLIFHLIIKHCYDYHRTIITIIYDLIVELSYGGYIFNDDRERYEFTNNIRSFLCASQINYRRNDIRRGTYQDVIKILIDFREKFKKYEQKTKGCGI